MIAFSNCKINLGLNIIEKRIDGYHNIQTVFYPLPLYDIIELVEAHNTTIEISGLKINDSPQNNLCLKAYLLLKKFYHIPPVKIFLHKSIPVGAGLGGGSSNAAFTIKLLNDMFSLNISNENLKKFAAMIGSDCAFFIDNKPVLASGIGDIFYDIISPDLLKDLWILIIKPDIHVNTADAYKRLNPDVFINSINKQDAFVKSFSLPLDDWKNCIYNDFEKNIFNIHPQLKTIKNLLYENDAVYASMTGSGAAIFGIFKSKPSLNVFPNFPFFWLEKL